jgi:hypothetical protein
MAEYSRHKGLLIAGSLMVAEGAALAAFGSRYLDFVERNGLMDVGKRLLRKLNVRSSTALAAFGLAEAVWGLVLLRRATGETT